MVLCSPPCPAMAPWYRLDLLIALVCVASPGWSFNLEPREWQMYPYPGAGSQGREPYFGFAVALQKQHTNGSAWLVVGAPRANSSEYLPDLITEPGAVFKCNLESHKCEELIVDREVIDDIIQDPKKKGIMDGGWLGGFLDTQPSFEKGRQITGVCAPRRKNLYFNYIYIMTGVCYSLNISSPTTQANELWIDSYSKLEHIITVNGTKKKELHYGQLGLSVHFPDEPTEMLVGSPGDFKGRGIVVRFKDREPRQPIDSLRRRRNSVSEWNLMFVHNFLPKSEYTTQIQEADYMGYALTSGRYLKRQELLYAAGAPRGANSSGKVFIFSFPLAETSPLKIKQELLGDQLGANFGASLTSADINGDGLSDLVVGAPMFSLKDLPDMGTVWVFLGSQDGQMLQMANTGYHGARVSSARFGTTLTSLGDLNGDGFQDVAVGAPFEGSGAVYIYLGSPGGLRAPHSQRLAPEDFTPGLRGFGMALSRGIDVDDNSYPDLAIGSFLSGHAVVVRSRPVAILVGSVTASPSSITLKEKSFQITACIQYGGHKVPRQLAVKGNVTLDPQASRVLFTGSNANFRHFNDTLNVNDSNCQTYNVSLKDRRSDPHEPILLRLDFQVAELDTASYVSQPITDPTATSGVTSRVSIVTGCETDGDDTCHTDLRLDTSFLNYGSGQKLVIGEDEKPVLEVSVFNLGEPSFLSNMTVEVAPPLALLLPSSHNCSFPVEGDGTFLLCDLSNPITKDRQDTVQVTVDAGQLTDASSELEVRVVVAGDGVEVQPLDNAFVQSLQLEAQAKLRLHGYSQEEQVFYTLDKNGNINSTLAATVLHTFIVLKEGPTPVGQVGLNISIPVKFQSGETFLKIFPPSKKDQCQLFGAEFAEDSIEGGVVTRSKPHQQPQAMVPERTMEYNCTNREVECARLHCRLDSWPGDTASAELTLKFSIDLAVLAQHMPAMAGAVLKSSAQASILSLNPLITFTGDRTASIEVVTQFQPERLMGEAVPWWIILLAVLGGLLLLGLLAYGCKKAGFFQRKERDEMRGVHG